MASSFLQRSALVLLPAAAIASCTGDRVMPPQDIAANPTRSATSDRQLEGRVEDVDAGRQLLGPAGSPVAYAAEPVRGNQGSAAIDYLDTPNLAGLDSGAAAETEMTSSEGMALPPAEPGTEALSSPAGGAYDIPAEGINIDAELGVAPSAEPREPVAPQILVPQGPMAIAEGTTAQPVVDGIGTENPVILPPDGQEITGGGL